jgi:ABC-type thiamine transport system ATPase subunit
VDADAFAPDALVLFNESFSATNERVGSEVGDQIAGALREARIKVVFVTHHYALLSRLLTENRADILFLRAGYVSDGRRNFKLTPDLMLQTS